MLPTHLRRIVVSMGESGVSVGGIDVGKFPGGIHMVVVGSDFHSRFGQPDEFLSRDALLMSDSAWEGPVENESSDDSLVADEVSGGVAGGAPAVAPTGTELADDAPNAAASVSEPAVAVRSGDGTNASSSPLIARRELAIPSFGHVSWGTKAFSKVLQNGRGISGRAVIVGVDTQTAIALYVNCSL